MTLQTIDKKKPSLPQNINFTSVLLHKFALCCSVQLSRVEFLASNFKLHPSSLTTRPQWPSRCLVLWKGPCRRGPGAGLARLALSYQLLCLCIQLVAAPTSAFSDGKHCFSSGFKDRSLKAQLPSALLDNRWVHKQQKQLTTNMG